MLMEGSIEDVPWYWWVIVVLALLYTTHDVQYRMAENLRLLQNPIINSTYRAVMRMTLNWKDARIFYNSWSSFFSSTREMKSLHWNGLLSRAFSENWFPQVNKSSWSLFLYFFFVNFTAWFSGPSKTICRIFFAKGVPLSWRQYICLKNNWRKKAQAFKVSLIDNSLWFTYFHSFHWKVVRDKA